MSFLMFMRPKMLEEVGLNGDQEGRLSIGLLPCFVSKNCKAVDHVCFTSKATSSLQQATALPVYTDDECVNIDWDNLGFGLVPTDFMYTMKCSKDVSFTEGQLSLYGNIELSPSAGVLNYGQGLFEGMKAYRRQDGRLGLFRPEQNAMRMQMGAERMCMPSPSVEQFIDGVKQTALANK